jgi:hypothetical protein
MRKDDYRKQSGSTGIHLGARTAMEYLHSPVRQAPLGVGQEL